MTIFHWVSLPISAYSSFGKSVSTKNIQLVNYLANIYLSGHLPRTRKCIHSATTLNPTKDHANGKHPIFYFVLENRQLVGVVDLRKQNPTLSNTNVILWNTAQDNLPSKGRFIVLDLNLRGVHLDVALQKEAQTLQPVFLKRNMKRLRKNSPVQNKSKRSLNMKSVCD